MIPTAGRARTRADHTWDARLSALRSHLGLEHRGADPNAPTCPLDVVANLSNRPWCADSPGCMPDGGSAAIPLPELDATGGRG